MVDPSQLPSICPLCLPSSRHHGWVLDDDASFDFALLAIPNRLVESFYTFLSYLYTLSSTFFSPSRSPVSFPLIYLLPLAQPVTAHATTSTMNMLPEQSFARPNLVPSNEPVTTTGPSPFPAPAAFSGDFLGLSLQDDENLWGLSPISTSGLPSWAGNGKDQAFGNPGLERELKNSHVRNGQPTPPPFDDGNGNGKHSPDLYTLAQCQLDGSPPISLDQRHFGSDTTTASGLGISASAKRRKMSRHGRYSGMESDGSRREKAKREKFLERNRLAASKCRQKKKEHTMLLETRYKEQADKKEKLMAEIARLRSDLLALKNEVLKHAQCGDEPIKLHLAQMVKRITYNDTGSEVTDGGDAASSSEAATTPIAAAATAAPPSFGFDDQLRIETQRGPGLEGTRRDSESSLVSEGSYEFGGDDGFEELINV